MKFWFLLILGIAYIAMWPAMIGVSKEKELDSGHMIAGVFGLLGVIVIGWLIAGTS